MLEVICNNFNTQLFCTISQFLDFRICNKISNMLNDFPINLAVKQLNLIVLSPCISIFYFVICSCIHVGLCICVFAGCKGPCGLWESQPSVWLCSTVPVELCSFSEILSGTLANDPIKTCITTDLTRDYTLQSTREKWAALSDTVE